MEEGRGRDSQLNDGESVSVVNIYHCITTEYLYQINIYEIQFIYEIYVRVYAMDEGVNGSNSTNNKHTDNSTLASTCEDLIVSLQTN